MTQTKEVLESPDVTLSAPPIETRSTVTSPWLRRLTKGLNIRGRIRTSSGEVIELSPEEPLFEVTFHRDDLLKSAQDEFSLGQAYVNGDIDFEGDMMALLDARDALTERFRWLPSLRFAKNL